MRASEDQKLNNYNFTLEYSQRNIPGRQKTMEKSDPPKTFQEQAKGKSIMVYLSGGPPRH